MTKNNTEAVTRKMVSVDNQNNVCINDNNKLSQTEVEERAKNELIVGDLDKLTDYGLQDQSEVNDLSNTILAHLKNSDIDSVSKNIFELITKIKDINGSSENDGFLPKLFKKFRHKKEEIAYHHESVEKNLDQIKNVFMEDRTKLQADNEYLIKYQEALTKSVQSITNDIQVLKFKKQQIDTHDLPYAQSLLKQENTIENNNRVVTLQDYSDQLSKKIYDLNASLTLVQQTLVELHVTHLSNITLINKIHSTIVQSIPHMQQQLALAALQNKLNATIQHQELFDKTENELIKDNAKTFHENTVKAVDLLNQPSMKYETLEESANEIVQTLDEINKKSDEYKTQREQETEKIGQLVEFTRKLTARVPNPDNKLLQDSKKDHK